MRPGGAQMETCPSVEQVTKSRLRPRPLPGWLNQRACLTQESCARKTASTTSAWMLVAFQTRTVQSAEADANKQASLENSRNQTSGKVDKYK